MAQADAPYWITTSGINRRIKSLAQDFNYLIVNNAFKVLAPTNGAQWLRWLDMGDANVCDTCLYHSTQGGRGGFYHVTWFTPIIPVHNGCRCQWEIWFEDPFEQTILGGIFEGIQGA